MLDLRWIRQNPQDLDRSLRCRRKDPISKEILDLDRLNRESLTQLQQLRTQRNDLCARIAQKRTQGEDVSQWMNHAQELKEQESNHQKEQGLLQKRLDEWLIKLPNILQDEVPNGHGEEDNVECRRWGQVALIEKPKDHVTLGIGVDGLDIEGAVSMSGSRFYLLKKDLAKMERALGEWMLDHHLQEGFLEISPPYIVKEEAVFGAGQLPKFREDLFETTQGSFLISTGEVPLVNYSAGKIFEQDDLPLRMTTLTPCFRSEAGSAGKDLGGMIRVHQFRKVELFSVCRPDQSEAEHQKIVSIAESLLQKLSLPYRVMLLCGPDTGEASTKTYDIEVFLPAQNRYREISSCSNCGDFQSRRVKARYREANGLPYVHMLNGSGLPTGRTLVAILENFQNSDGSIDIPTVLRPYMGGKKRIERYDSI